QALRPGRPHPDGRPGAVEHGRPAGGPSQGRHQPARRRGAGLNDALVAHLLQHAVRRGGFVLRSGRRSDWFIDAKQTTCRPDGMLLVADAVLRVLPDDVTAIGGLTMGADAVAFGVAGVAATRGRMLRSFSVRKEG